MQVLRLYHSCTSINLLLQTLSCANSKIDIKSLSEMLMCVRKLSTICNTICCFLLRACLLMRKTLPRVSIENDSGHIPSNWPMIFIIICGPSVGSNMPNSTSMTIALRLASRYYTGLYSADSLTPSFNLSERCMQRLIYTCLNLSINVETYRPHPLIREIWADY